MLVNNAGISLRGVDLVGTKRADWERVLAVNLTGTVPRHPGGGARDPRQRRRRDRQYRLDRRHQWPFRGRLQRLEMGPARADQGGGARFRRLEYPGQRRAPQYRADADGGGFGEFRRGHGIDDAAGAQRLRSQDVANAVLFLASEQASFLTGLDLPVDGGFTELGTYTQVRRRAIGQGQALR